MTEKNLNEGLVDIRLLDKSYQDALALTEEIAIYLEHENKALVDKSALNADVNYVSESMRISTCLMEVLSWYLLQKAVSVGEMSKNQAGEENFRLGAEEICLKQMDSYKENLPPKLMDYLEKSQDLYRQVARMDAMIYESNKEKCNPVHDLMKKIDKDID